MSAETKYQFLNHGHFLNHETIHYIDVIKCNVYKVLNVILGMTLQRVCIPQVLVKKNFSPESCHTKMSDDSETKYQYREFLNRETIHEH